MKTGGFILAFCTLGLILVLLRDSARTPEPQDPTLDDADTCFQTSFPWVPLQVARYDSCCDNTHCVISNSTRSGRDGERISLIFLGPFLYLPLSCLSQQLTEAGTVANPILRLWRLARNPGHSDNKL